MLHFILKYSVTISLVLFHLYGNTQISKISVRKKKNITVSIPLNTRDTIFTDTVIEPVVLDGVAGVLRKRDWYIVDYDLFFNNESMYVFNRVLPKRLRKLANKKNKRNRFFKRLAKLKNKEKIDYSIHAIKCNEYTITKTNINVTEDGTIVMIIDTVNNDTISKRFKQPILNTSLSNFRSSHEVIINNDTLGFSEYLGRYSRRVLTSNQTPEYDVYLKINNYINSDLTLGKYKMSKKIDSNYWYMELSAMNFFDNKVLVYPENGEVNKFNFSIEKDVNNERIKYFALTEKEAMFTKGKIHKKKESFRTKVGRKNVKFKLMKY